LSSLIRRHRHPGIRAKRDSREVQFLSNLAVIFSLADELMNDLPQFLSPLGCRAQGDLHRRHNPWGRQGFLHIFMNFIHRERRFCPGKLRIQSCDASSQSFYKIL
jgi:hypothetical protein